MYLYEYVLESANILRKRCLRTDQNVFEMFLWQFAEKMQKQNLYQKCQK